MKNIFADIPDSLDQEIFEQIQTGEGLRIERILSRGHSSPPSDWCDQDWNEWVLVLKGEAVLSFEDRTTVRLKEGDFLNIPSHTRHKVDWTDPDRNTIWLAVHY
jgi:cupin 2 domain-containing protein